MLTPVFWKKYVSSMILAKNVRSDKKMFYFEILTYQ